MKIFNWMQNKLHGRLSINKPNPIPANYHRQEACKEEFSDWPHGLLAIGTFGNSQEKSNLPQENPSYSSQDHHHHLHDLTLDEIVGRLQDELEQMMLDNHDERSAADQLEFCPNNSSSEADDQEKEDEGCCDDLQDRNGSGRSQRSTSVVLSRGKDVCLDSKKSGIGKKSLSFLLRKMFVCTSGFAAAPTPSPRDHPFPESRMEKILGAILQKKIYPQSCSPKAGAKKYLENKDVSKTGHEEQKILENGKEGSKWVKTDSEYIVLEI